TFELVAAAPPPSPRRGRRGRRRTDRAVRPRGPVPRAEAGAGPRGGGWRFGRVGARGRPEALPGRAAPASPRPRGGAEARRQRAIAGLPCPACGAPGLGASAPGLGASAPAAWGFAGCCFAAVTSPV